MHFFDAANVVLVAHAVPSVILVMYWQVTPTSKISKYCPYKYK